MKSKDYSLWEKILFGVFGAGLVALDIYLFNAKPCEGIDQIYLSCRFTGSVWDWVGAVITNVSWAYFPLKAFNPSYSKTDKGNPMRWAFIGIAVGLIVIYSL